jgi:hypothetical protein
MLSTNKEEAMAYTTRKINRNRVAIEKDGEVVCYVRAKEAAGWIWRAEKSEAEEATYAAERRAARLANVQAYLAVRATRRAEAARQLNLFA